MRRCLESSRPYATAGEKVKDKDKPHAAADAKVKGVEASAPSMPKQPSNPKANPNPKPDPKGATAEGQGGQVASKHKCSFYLNANGCKKGKDCTWEHDWKAIPVEDRPQRRRTCGAKGHKPSERRAGTNQADGKAKATAPNPKALANQPAAPPAPSSR